MKSIFSKLSTLLLCGAVAMVGCTDYSDDIQDLEAKTTASIEQVKKDLSTLKAEVEATYATKEALAGVVAELEALEGDVAELEALVANKADKTELEAAKKDLQDKIDAAKNELNKKIDDAKSELQGNIDAAKTELNKKIDDAVAAVNDELTKINTRIGAAESQIDTLKSDVKGLSDKLDETAEDLQTKIDAANVKIDTLDARVGKLENAVTVLQGDVEELNNAVEDLRDDVNEMGNRLNELTALVNMTYSRVQSLVYVPKYSDGKATLDWAVVNPYGSTFQFPTILNKASDLKYLVKANTPEEAANAASAIAAAWKKVLDYAVEPVEIRTKAVEPADLEIVNVVASGDSIIVSVVAKNFETSFYEDPAEGIYSAALALKDENGANLTSEYTNLVPAKVPEKYEMALFVAEEDEELGEVSMNMVTEVNDTIPYLMPCNNDTTVYSAVKPVVGFVPAGIQPTNPASYLTEEDLTKQGYDVTVDMDILITDENNYNHDGTMDTKPGPITIDEYFNIMGGDPVYDFHYTVKPGVDFENKGKYSIVTYEFTCGETVKTLSYRFELANAQVTVTYEKDIFWSIAFADRYIVNGNFKENLYKYNGFADSDRVTIEGANEVLDLAALLAGKPSRQCYVKSEAGWNKVVWDKRVVEKLNPTVDGDYSIGLHTGNYSFNNSYKTVYTTTIGNVDYNIAFVVNLDGYQESITVKMPVEFELDGKLGEFAAPVALADSTYKYLTEDYDFLGYGEKNAETWASMFESYVEPYMAGKLDMPYVNGVKSNWSRNILNLESARLFYNDTAKQVKEGINTITWEVSPVKGFTVKYEISGNVKTPAGKLLTADSYVVQGVAIAKGQIDANGVYSIIESHLPYYFNVDGPLGAHNYTVQFEVEAPNATTGNDVKLSNKDHLTVGSEKDGTYYPINGDAILDWDTYTGLKVNVKATLYANGYPVDNKSIVVETVDPLTFTIANVEVNRTMRENTSVQIFKNAVLTSLVEPEVTNLINFTKTDGTKVSLTNVTEAFEDAKKAYGVNITIVNSDPQAPSHVYYWDNEGKNKVYLPKGQYELKDGILTINGDDVTAKNYYAEFTVTMDSRICAGPHTQNVKITFVGTK